MQKDPLAASTIRKLFWGALAFLIFAVDFIIIEFLSVNFQKWDYVPTVANGIVSASSILMAVALFSINYFRGATVNTHNNRRFHSFAMHHMLMLFALLIGEVFLGYLAVSLNILPIALSFFMTFFFVQCGVIFDIWVVGESFSDL